MADVRTLLIGDEIAEHLEAPFRNLPGIGPLWVYSYSGSGIDHWATGNLLEKAVDSTTRKGAQGPTLVVVSLGRVDMLLDRPDGPDDYLSSVEADTNALLDRITDATGARVVWVLPPAIPGEGKVRSIVEATLRARGVPMFHGEKELNATDAPASPGRVTPAAFSPDVYADLADKLARWIPLGTRSPQAPRPQIKLQPRTGSSAAAESVSARSGMSLALWILGGAVVAGGVVAIASRSKPPPAPEARHG